MSDKKTVYLCGPISSRLATAKEEFLLAQVELKKLGFKVINPFDLIEGTDLDPIKDYEEIMCIVVAEMVRWAHQVVLLPGVMTSDGCVREMEIARWMRKEIVKIETYLPSYAGF